MRSAAAGQSGGAARAAEGRRRRSCNSIPRPAYSDLSGMRFMTFKVSLSGTEVMSWIELRFGVSQTIS
jgi:hypothetical protein